MQLSNDMKNIIIQFIVLTYLMIEILDLPYEPLYRQPYCSTPAITLQKLIQKPNAFKNWTNFELETFYNVLLTPMKKFIQIPKTFLLNINKNNSNSNNIDNNIDNNNDGCELDYDFDPRTTRGCVLSVHDRILRWLLILKGETMARIEYMFDQHQTTAFRDFIHCCFACIHALSKQYLKPLTPGSEEFNNLKGAGCLKHFPNVNLIGDVTKIRISRTHDVPDVPKDSFKDGHHCQYDAGFLVFCDGFGIAHLVHGPSYGSCNDINTWTTSEWNGNVEKYFGDGLALFDGIFRHVKGPFVCSFPNPKNEEELLFNLFHILARAMIEHFFGRQKAYWPIIGQKYPYHFRYLDIVYRVCTLLTNILITCQTPMRKK